MIFARNIFPDFWRGGMLPASVPPSHTSVRQSRKKLIYILNYFADALISKFVTQ